MQINSREPPVCAFANCSSCNADFVSKVQIVATDLEALLNSAHLKPASDKPTIFKSCHYCRTFYCSALCRELDWSVHKRDKCFNGALASLCKRILVKIGRNASLRIELSRVATSAFVSTCQRGFVWLNFSDSSDAHAFMQKKLETAGGDLSNFLLLFGSNLLPKYVTFSAHGSSTIMQQLFNNNNNDNNAEALAVFSRLCQDYDPHKEFLLLVSVSVSPDKSHQSPGKYILQYMKMTLLDKRPVNSATTRDSVKLPPTLILTAMDAEASKQRRAGVLEMESRPAVSTTEHRELFLANIVCNFEERGINLRASYPQIYSDLCRYVAEGVRFAPVCLFPRDLTRNNLFMCLIMPHSEPADFAWFYECAEEAAGGELKLANYVCVV